MFLQTTAPMLQY